MKNLVAIANHGEGNRGYLDCLLAAHREMGSNMVVLSNIPKDLGPDVEVKVGVPTDNPWSLPFAHRPLFRDRLKEFDYFLYSEDDTLVRSSALEAFVDSTTVLGEREIAGFIRTEQGPDGTLYYSSCHSFFRWLPASVRERGGKLWAKYSNEHAACFIASRAQLQAAFASGGFDDEPHEGRHDMLCAAATDIYTRCGFDRLVCIDDLDRFTLPHLPNKYIGRMGLRRDLMERQLEGLRAVHRRELPNYELLEPETKLPGCRGSKSYYEQPDDVLLQMVPSDAKRVVSWGCGSGELEEPLVRRGVHVVGIPLDAVIGTITAARGIEVVLGPEEHAMEALDGCCPDAVIVSDILHLVDQPEYLIGQLGGLLKSRGLLALRVPNFGEVGHTRRRSSDSRYPKIWNRATIGAWPFSPGRLKLMFADAGFDDVQIRWDVPARRLRSSRLTGSFARRWLSPRIYAYGKKR